LTGGVAHAACTCNVNSLADPSAVGRTTLRDAITSANLNPGSAITFASGLTGTITLASDLPSIYYATTISGPGAGQITISGNNAHPVFDVYVDFGDPVTISGLTITGGSTTFRGGAVHSDAANLTLSGLVLTGNRATSQSGGAVAADDGGSLNIVDSTISGNTAPNSGGGVFTLNLSGTTTTIRNSTISGNHSNFAGGGAYFDYSSPASVIDSTIYGNSSTSSGGGLFHYGGPTSDKRLTVTGSTISSNSAARGGGIASSATAASAATPVLQNTIVAHNIATTAGADVSAGAGSMSAAFSLIGVVDPATTLNQAGPNLLGQDAQLTPLAMNGGPTATQRPAPSSPAIEQGKSFGLRTDQRGAPRPFLIPLLADAPHGDGSDIGAVELQASELPPNQFGLKVKGKKLMVAVKAPGSVTIEDSVEPLSAANANGNEKHKKKRTLLLNPDVRKGGPPTISVPLQLTKPGRETLNRKGRVRVKARITFTPDFGIAKTRTVKLTIKRKKKK
jgi:hypothetical protein